MELKEFVDLVLCEFGLASADVASGASGGQAVVGGGEYELAVQGGDEVPPANWTAGVYAAGTRLCLSKDLVSSGVTYP